MSQRLTCKTNIPGHMATYLAVPSQTEGRASTSASVPASNSSSSSSGAWCVLLIQVFT